MSESVSEFFDAQEVLLSASSSENEVRFLDVSTPTTSDCEFELKSLSKTMELFFFFNIIVRCPNCSKKPKACKLYWFPFTEH